MPSTISINTVPAEDVFLNNPSPNAVLFSSEIANLVRNPNFPILFNNNSIPKEKLQPIDATNILQYSLSGGFSTTTPRQIAPQSITSYNLAYNAAGGLQGGVAVGTVVTYYGRPQSEGGVLPEGYFPCDGRFLLVAEYPELFSSLSYRFGDDGASKFRLPTLSAPLSAIALIKY
jgi:hypothetical protein